RPLLPGGGQGTQSTPPRCGGRSPRRSRAKQLRHRWRGNRDMSACRSSDQSVSSPAGLSLAGIIAKRHAARLSALGGSVAALAEPAALLAFLLGLLPRADGQVLRKVRARAMQQRVVPVARAFFPNHAADLVVAGNPRSSVVFAAHAIRSRSHSPAPA